MRLGILLLILAATLFGSGFWYTQVTGVCRVPIAYRIGTIDERFNTNAEEIRRIAAKAEAIWEAGTSKELFIYDEAEDALPIHLVFDDRQERSDREAELREDLAAKEGMNESVAAQYEALIAEFRSFKKQYEARVMTYEDNLKAYNDTVTDWNDQGGAPPEVIDDLKRKEADLKREYEALDELSDKLNRVVADLNRIGAKGNSLVADYNSIVEKYNDQFSEGHEFTQGDYTGDAIHIYQFDSEDELTLVLAHEFGHALALDHVENESSIMYHFMEKQGVTNGLTAEDLVEYGEICAERGVAKSIGKLLFNR